MGNSIRRNAVFENGILSEGVFFCLDPNSYSLLRQFKSEVPALSLDVFRSVMDDKMHEFDLEGDFSHIDERAKNIISEELFEDIKAEMHRRLFLIRSYYYFVK